MPKFVNKPQMVNLLLKGSTTTDHKEEESKKQSRFILCRFIKKKNKRPDCFERI